jgi:hypothetical protein
MITPQEANGFLAVVYETMERMTTKDRIWFLKAIKMAKKSMDINYPMGKSDEPNKDANQLITPEQGLIVPGGNA